VRGRLLSEMEAFPILITPVCSVPAFRHGERGWKIGGRPWAISMRCGTRSGSICLEHLRLSSPLELQPQVCLSVCRLPVDPFRMRRCLRLPLRSRMRLVIERRQWHEGDSRSVPAASIMALERWVPTRLVRNGTETTESGLRIRSDHSSQGDSPGWLASPGTARSLDKGMCSCHGTASGRR